MDSNKGIYYKMRDVVEQHIKETILYRTELEKLPDILIADIVSGFDG
jgi:hypothetical protein